MTMTPMPSQLEWREADRLVALESYGVMDTPAENEFDDIVRVAAEICGVPMALVSLVDGERQWFKAALGLEVSETPREIAFCAQAIQQEGVLIVGDASVDPRFAANPLVTDNPNLRFYAGAPLVTPDGFPLGTLCVLDQKPGDLSPGQVFALKTLARQVMTQLELRKALAIQRSSEERHRRILESAIDYAIISMDLQGVITSWNEGAYRILGWSPDEARGLSCALFFTPEDRAAEIPQREMAAALAKGRGSDERWHLRKGGERFWASGEMMPLTDEDGAPVGFLKILRDRTDYRLAQEALVESEAAAERDRRLLAGEMEHRVKNTLAMAQALVAQSLRRATSLSDAARSVEDRLVSLGRAHDVLTRANWAAAPIGDVVAAATGVLAVSPDRITLSGPDISIKARAVVGLTMALHELCTNATKYGAFSNDQGRVSVEWSTSGEGACAVLEMTWRETGGPPVVAPSHKGFGSRLIGAGLLGASGDQSTLEFLPEGVVWRARSPLDQIREVPLPAA